MDVRTHSTEVGATTTAVEEPTLLTQMKAFWSDDRRPVDVELGRDIGFEFARLGMKLPDETGGQAVEEGYAEGRHYHARFHDPSDQYERKLVRLRLSAYKRNRAIDPLVTPSFLASINVRYCPITRIELTRGTGEGTDATVDRVFNGGGYAIGNLAIMSMRANQAKGALMPLDILKIATEGNPKGGLERIEWMRLACLTALAAPPGYAMTHLPLYVYPPNGIMLTNGYTLVQVVTTACAACFLQERWEAELRKVLSGKKSKKLFDGFMEALIGKVGRAARGIPDPELARFALCDCWSAELVYDRYKRLMEGIGKADLAAMVRVATRAQQSMRKTSVNELERVYTPKDIEEAWRLRTNGYTTPQ